MHRLLARMVALTFAALVLVAPTSALAASGCAQLDEAKERAECTARQQARDEARREVDARVGGGSTAAKDGASDRSAAWSKAVEEASGPDLGEIFAPRPIAAVIGIAWFALLVRRGWRSRRRVAG